MDAKRRISGTGPAEPKGALFWQLGSREGVVDPVVPALPLGADIAALAAAGISSGTPTLADAALAEIHALAADGITTGAPSLDEPELVSHGTDALEADGIATDAPTLGTPALSDAAGVTPRPPTGAPMNFSAAFWRQRYEKQETPKKRRRRAWPDDDDDEGESIAPKLKLEAGATDAPAISAEWLAQFKYAEKMRAIERDDMEMLLEL